MPQTETSIFIRDIIYLKEFLGFQVISFVDSI